MTQTFCSDNWQLLKSKPSCSVAHKAKNIMSRSQHVTSVQAPSPRAANQRQTLSCAQMRESACYGTLRMPTGRPPAGGWGLAKEENATGRVRTSATFVPRSFCTNTTWNCTCAPTPASDRTAVPCAPWPVRRKGSSCATYDCTREKSHFIVAFAQRCSAASVIGQSTKRKYICSMLCMPRSDCRIAKLHLSSV